MDVSDPSMGELSPGPFGRIVPLKPLTRKQSQRRFCDLGASGSVAADPLWGAGQVKRSRIQNPNQKKPFGWAPNLKPQREKEIANQKSQIKN